MVINCPSNIIHLVLRYFSLKKVAWGHRLLDLNLVSLVHIGSSKTVARGHHVPTGRYNGHHTVGQAL